VVPPAFAVAEDVILRYCLGARYNGRITSLLQYVTFLDVTFSSESNLGEVDFVICPTALHKPAALCTDE